MKIIMIWLQRYLGSYGYPAVRRMLVLGFSSGLPFLLVLPTLSARLRQAGIDRTTIGLYSLVGLAYSVKLLWSPVVDRVRLPGLVRLGQRRGWLLLAQLGVLAGLLALAFPDPARQPVAVAVLACMTAFFSSTQDIVIDAYRIESSGPELQSATAASYMMGYQIAFIFGGAFALLAASSYGWTKAYLIMAGCMVVGPWICLCIPEPVAMADRQVVIDSVQIREVIGRMRARSLWMTILVTLVVGLSLHLALSGQSSVKAVNLIFGIIVLIELALLVLLHTRIFPVWREKLIAAVVMPLGDVWRRLGKRAAVAALFLMVTYRLNYMTMGMSANTFYLDMGYSLDQIALASKIYGIVFTLAGALMAGDMVRRVGALRIMLLGLVSISLANLLYAHIATLTAHPPMLTWLLVAVSLDNVANGMASASFIAWMASLTSKDYTATQCALFGTLWSLPAKGIASQWGRIVDATGYPVFYIYTAIIAIPALILVLWLLRNPAPGR